VVALGGGLGRSASRGARGPLNALGLEIDAALAVEIVTGAVLAAVTLFFLVKDGHAIWPRAVRLFPPRARDDVRAIGELAWDTAAGYIRSLTIVAAVDAVLIALALWLIGVPFVLPLAALTFVGGFFPIVGAFVAGTAAALVALVAEGWTAALLVVGATILVQQLEGNVLQPYVVGSAVRVHPLAILLAITAGGILWGIAGAFLAVPLVAVCARAWGSVASRGRRGAIEVAEGGDGAVREARAGAAGGR
jgi:predicted PurR-regulated permease PerM